MDGSATVLLAIGPLRHFRTLASWLDAAGFRVEPARTAEDACSAAASEPPRLVIYDADLPGLTGADWLARLRAATGGGWLPALAVVEPEEAARQAALAAGADDVICHPVSQAELLARVRVLLRSGQREATVQRLTAELAHLGRTVDAKAARQAAELERIARLHRLLPRATVERLLAAGQQPVLENHRRQIAVLFCDLRGFTAFAEVAEPEEVMAVLREYHAAVGQIVAQVEGTVGHLAGDGLMVFFNDPLPCLDPAGRAVRAAVALRERMDDLTAAWQRAGHRLGFGVGVTLGYATLGRIGFDGRFDYGAIGSVVNLASRLCDEAQAGEVLISQAVHAALEGIAEADELPPLALKGFARPVPAFRIVALRGGPVG